MQITVKLRQDQSLQVCASHGLTLQEAVFTIAGGSLKSFALGHLAYLLIRQFQLLIEDLSVSVELDQAVDLPPSELALSLTAA